MDFGGMTPASESEAVGRRLFMNEEARELLPAGLARFRRAVGPVIPCRVASQQSPTPLHQAMAIIIDACAVQTGHARGEPGIAKQRGNVRDETTRQRLRPVTFHACPLRSETNRPSEYRGAWMQSSWSNLPCSRFDGPVYRGARSEQQVGATQVAAPRGRPRRPGEQSKPIAVNRTTPCKPPER